MKLADLPDDFTQQEFMLLEREDLDKVPYEIKKWQCQVKDCTNGTKVRDYGLSPHFLLHRNSKACLGNHPFCYWRNLETTMWLCGRHYPLVMRLEKRFDKAHIGRRLGLSPSPLTKIVSIASTKEPVK